jgi:hypothetical protein
MELSIEFHEKKPSLIVKKLQIKNKKIQGSMFLLEKLK